MAKKKKSSVSTDVPIDAAGDSPVTAPAQGDASVVKDESVKGEVPATEKVDGEVTGTEETVEQVRTVEKTDDEVTATEITDGDVTATEKTAEQVLDVEKTAEQVLDVEKTAGELTATEKTVEQVQTVEKTVNDVSGAEKTAGEVTATEKTAEQVLDVEKTAGELTATEKTAGEVTATENTAGEVTATEKTASDADNVEKEEIKSVGLEEPVAADLPVLAEGDTDNAETGQVQSTATDSSASTEHSASTAKAADPVVASDDNASQGKGQGDENDASTAKAVESDATGTAVVPDDAKSKTEDEVKLNNIAQVAPIVEKQKVEIEAVTEVEEQKSSENEAPKESDSGPNDAVGDDVSAEIVKVDEKSGNPKVGETEPEIAAASITPENEQEQNSEDADTLADTKANDVAEQQEEQLPDPKSEVPSIAVVKTVEVPVVDEKNIDAEVVSEDDREVENTSRYETADEADDEKEDDTASEKKDFHPNIAPKHSSKQSGRSANASSAALSSSKPQTTASASSKLSTRNSKKSSSSKSGKDSNREKYRLIFQKSVEAFLAKDFKKKSIKTIVASIPGDVVVSEETFRKVFELVRKVQKLPEEERQLPLSYLCTCFLHLADAEPIFVEALGDEKLLTGENFDVDAVIDGLKVELDHMSPAKASHQRQLAWALMGNFSKTLHVLFQYAALRTHRFAPNLMKSLDAITPMLLKIDPAGVRFTEAFIGTIKWNAPNEDLWYWDNIVVVLAALIKGSAFNGGTALECLLKTALECPKEVSCILYVALYINNHCTKSLWDENATTVRKPEILVATLLKLLANDSAALSTPYAAFSIIDFAGKIGTSWGTVFRDHVSVVAAAATENVDWRIRCAVLNRVGLIGHCEISGLSIPKSIYKIVPDKDKERFVLLEDDEEESLENYLFHVMEFVLMGTMIPELFLENARSAYTPTRKFFDILKTSTCRAVKSVEQLYTPEIGIVYQSMISKLIETFFHDTSCNFSDTVCNFQQLTMAKYQSCILLGQVAHELIVDRCGYRAHHLDTFLASEYNLFSGFVTCTAAYSRAIYCQRNDRSVPWRQKGDNKAVWPLNDYQQSMFAATGLLTVGIQLLERMVKPPSDFIDVLKELEHYLGYIGPAIRGFHHRQFERSAQRPPTVPKLPAGNRSPAYYNSGNYPQSKGYRR